MNVVGTTVVRISVWSPLRRVVVIVLELVVADNEKDGRELGGGVSVELWAETTAALSRQLASHVHRIAMKKENRWW